MYHIPDAKMSILYHEEREDNNRCVIVETTSWVGALSDHYLIHETIKDSALTTRVEEWEFLSANNSSIAMAIRLSIIAFDKLVEKYIEEDEDFPLPF